MGVDYSAYYGIGIKLNISPEEFLEEEGFDDYDEYLESLPKSDFFELVFFEVGDSYVEDCEVEYYLCIKNPLSKGFEGLNNIVGEFKYYLSCNNIHTIGEVDIVGGLHIH